MANNTSKIIALLIAAVLPFGNITLLFGIQDGFSFICIILLLMILIVDIRIRKNFRTVKKIDLIFTLFLLATLISTIYGLIPIASAIFNGGKIIFLLLLASYVRRNPDVSFYFWKYYYRVFLFSLFVSLPIYAVFPIEEFVFFDGSEARFGGLHFELFNFLFSLMLFFYSWRKNNLNAILGAIIVFFLAYQSASNMIVAYLLVGAYAYLVSHRQPLSSLRYWLPAAVLCIPILIGYFLESLEILNLLAFRSVSSFSLEGSALFVRLYPAKLAIEQIEINGIASFFPMGAGYFENSPIVTQDEFSYGGTGSSKALVDLGVVFFGLLTIEICRIVSRGSGLIQSGDYKNRVFILYSTLGFMAFGAGFFNVVAWFVLWTFAFSKG